MALSRTSYRGFRRALAGLTAVLLVLAMTGPGLAALAFAEDPPAQEPTASAVEAPAPAAQPETPAPEAPQDEPKAEPPAVEPPAAPADPAPASDPAPETPSDPAVQASAPEAPTPQSPEPSGEPVLSVGSSPARAFDGHVTARKYNDSDGDGNRDSGEAYISGWGFVLTEYTTGSYTSVVRTISKTTDSNGVVDFTHDDPDAGGRLTAGYYKLAESEGPPGQTWVCTAAGTTSGFQLTDSSASRDCGSFGNQRLNNLISGHKYGDVDNSDAQDSSGPGLSGWTINLYKKNGSSWSVIDSVATASDGSWSFEGIATGQYYVQETLRSGWTQKHRPAYYDGTHYMTVTASSQFTGLNFFNYKAADVSVFKYRDANADGEYESHTDSALDSVGFTLKGPNNYSSHIHTNSSGNVSWSGLAAGDYTLTEAVPSGMSAPAGAVTSFTLAMGESRPMQIANVAHARLDVFKYEDGNGNGAFDAGHEGHSGHDSVEGEPALEGVGFTLTGPGGYESHRHTDSNGDVSWSDLSAGDYTLTEVLPGGLYAPGGTGREFSLTTGQTKSLEIGNIAYATVNIFKFNDLNGDGVHQDEEPALSGRSFTLTGPGCDRTDATDSEGRLTFADLKVGDYTLVENNMSGWFAKPAMPIEFTLSSGQTWSQNVGNIEAGKVVVGKYNDLDGDEVRDENEPALAREFTLTGPDGSVTGVTDATTGEYTFSDLPAGDYSLLETAVDHWVTTGGMPMGSFAVGIGQTRTFEVGNREIVHKTWRLDYSDHPDGTTFRVLYTLDGQDARSVSLDETTLDASVEVTAVAEIASWTWIASLEGEDFVLGTGADESVSHDTVNEFAYDSSVSGVKFEDLNANGVQDSGEPGLSGWQIEIYRRSQARPSLSAAGASGPADVLDGCVFADSTSTDGNGAYHFDGLLPGDYRLVSVTPDGWQRTVSPGDVEVADGVALGGEDFGYADPDLGVDVVASPSRAAAGSDILYAIRYFNTGNGAATDFTVADTFDPSQLEVIDAAGGEVSPGRITWKIAGPLAGGASSTLVVRMRLKSGLPAGLVVANTASISIIEVADTTAADNTSVADVTVAGGVLLPHTGADMLPLLLLALALGMVGLTVRRIAVRGV